MLRLEIKPYKYSLLVGKKEGEKEGKH